ncbi:unnamed protein product [marine sediment metagenome]|uniref:Uncharacterized protein n=1 Tax=marine sediment metagenome TaxID=412755 RepID=X0U0T3_9ZZZZ
MKTKTKMKMKMKTKMKMKMKREREMKREGVTRMDRMGGMMGGRWEDDGTIQ